MQSREWMAEHGYSEDVRSIAGKIAKIIGVEHGAYENRYRIDLDNGGRLWDEDEFDPGYRPDEPLSPEEAIRAMLDGETLYDDAGVSYFYSYDYRWFYVNDQEMDSMDYTGCFSNLHRRPEKRKRKWTRKDEIIGKLEEIIGILNEQE
jgi:hypothetical protein